MTEDNFKIELVALLSPMVEEIIRIAPNVGTLTEKMRANEEGADRAFVDLIAPLTQMLINASPFIVIAHRQNHGITVN